MKVPLLQAVPELAEDSRAMARWVVSEMPVDFSTPLFDSGPVEGDDSFPLPEGLLQPGREYAWRVVFQGVDGNWTDWSSATRFCTPPAAPDVVKGPVREDRVLGQAEGNDISGDRERVRPERDFRRGPSRHQNGDRA